MAGRIGQIVGVGNFLAGRIVSDFSARRLPRRKPAAEIIVNPGFCQYPVAPTQGDS
jgi:hypothetical protein